MNLGDIPAKIAANSPEREALVDVPNDRRITYGELEDRVSRLANSLRGDLGLQKGDRVAILSRNCIQYMEIMFAAARCGLIALPLNWRLSEPEMARLLEDGEPAVVFSSAEYQETAANLQKCVATTKLALMIPC